MKRPKVDAVIIGAGAAGGVVAHELAKAGLQTVLLERGRRLDFAETRHLELRSQRTWVLGNAFGPDDARHIRLIKSGGATEFRKTSAVGLGLQPRCGLRGGRYQELRSDGLALHAARLSDAHDLWPGRRIDARRLADRL